MCDLNDLLLRHTRLRAKIFYQGQNCGNWQFPTIVKNQAVFHLIIHGQCKIMLGSEQSAHVLQEGDLFFIARGIEHIIQAIDFDHSESQCSQEYSLAGGLRSDASGILCGTFEFDENVRNPLLEALPSSIIVRADFHTDPNWMKHLIALLIAESEHDSIGSNILVEKLVDTFFTHVVRCYLSSTSEKTGIFAAYTDQALRKVLEAIHQAPDKSWSLEDFSALSNLSRSAFIERFTKTLNETPMTYLMHIRMEMAYRFLKEDDRKVLDVALSCGYQSEAAFSKAFKRLYNMTPGDVRHKK